MGNKKLCSLVLIAFIMAVSVTAASPGTAGAAASKTTFMVYMIGSDLESGDPQTPAGTMDLEEMKSVASTANVNILVQTGGCSQWSTPGVSSTNNQRWKIENGAMNLIKDIGPKNMGEPATLSDFITWSVQSYPADRYILVFWDHGSGSVYGYGYDELYNGDGLDLFEMDYALNKAYSSTGKKLDMVGFDACLMASVETASMLVPYARYMVGSEEYEPGTGWDYGAVLSSINATPGQDMPAIGKKIAESYRKQCQEYDSADAITMSVIDLSKIQAVENALDNLAQTIHTNIGLSQGINSVAEARRDTESYGQYTDPDSCMDMVDLSGLAARLSAQNAAQSQAVQKAVTAAVVYNLTSPGKPYATGLSVYFPYEARGSFQERLELYRLIPFSTTYKDFIDAYTTALLKDTTAIEPEQEVPDLIETEENGVVTDESYTIPVAPSDLAHLADARSVLGAYLEDAVEGEAGTDIILYIGLDTDVDVDLQKGTLTSSVAHAWDMMQDQFVAMYYMESGDDFWEYYTPAILNGQDVDIVVLYNDQYPDGKVLGAKPVGTNDSEKVPKEFLIIKRGDRVTPVYYYENVNNSDDTGWIEGDEFTVNESELKIDYDILPTGTYYYGFWLTDFAGNESSTKFVSVYHDADEWYLPGQEESNPADVYTQYMGYDIPVNDTGSIQVVLNGELLEFEVNPLQQDGRVMVPFRTILEALGATVIWDAFTQTGIAHLGETAIMLPLGSTEPLINGIITPTEVAPFISQDTMLVPLRFVTEALGAEVEWFQDNQSVAIVTE